MPSHQRRGFALVELIVAIVIIALLIAVLLPALSAAAAAGRRAACASHLRQIVISESAHALDHDGRLTPFKWRLAGGLSDSFLMSNWHSTSPPTRSLTAVPRAFETAYAEPQERRGLHQLALLQADEYLDAAAAGVTTCPAQNTPDFADPAGKPDHPNYSFAPVGEIARNAGYVRRKFYGDFVVRWRQAFPIARDGESGRPKPMEEPFNTANPAAHMMQPAGIRLSAVGARALYADVHHEGTLVENAHRTGIGVAFGDGSARFFALEPDEIDRSALLLATPDSVPADAISRVVWRYADGEIEPPFGL